MEQTKRAKNIATRSMHLAMKELTREILRQLVQAMQQYKRQLGSVQSEKAYVELGESEEELAKRMHGMYDD